MKNLIFFFAFIFQISSLAQNKHFTGTWTKLETTYQFNFNLYLEHLPNQQVKGYFKWKAVKYDELDSWSSNYYKNKIGRTAKEFVSGTYNAKTKTYHLKGYKKDDPHFIIGKDVYKIKVDKDGDIGGDTKANNSWLGRIIGKAIEQVTL